MSSSPTTSPQELRALVAAEVASLHREHGDPFRRHARPATEDEAAFVAQIQDEAISTYALIAVLPASRERSLALSHLETAILFAAKAATSLPTGAR